MLTTSAGANYSGNLRSSTPFSQTYGYFEVRAKLPTAAGTTKGMWPAFWLMPANGVDDTEYDIFEVLGNAPNTIYQSVHWNTYANNSGYVVNGPDTSGWHTYGFQWDSGNIRWYIDGQLTNVAPNRITRAMYPMINLSVGGSWPGEPNTSTVFPASMEVKYLRVYSGGTVNSDIIKDNTDTVGITFNGTWTASTSTPGYYGSNYWHDGNTNKTAGQAIRWTPCLPSTGSYQVFARWTSGSSRCTSVPYAITHASGTTTVLANQQLNNGTWVSLGTYTFNAGTAGYVRVSTTGTTGHVIADAVRFLKQ
jgi:beta-glucanase (GH16 family)